MTDPLTPEQIEEGITLWAFEAAATLRLTLVQHPDGSWFTLQRGWDGSWFHYAEFDTIQDMAVALAVDLTDYFR